MTSMNISRATSHYLALFFDRVSVDPAGCWLWSGPINYKGYGVFLGTSAHRFTHVWFVGPIPDHFEVDHLCRVRACVNPAHLEAVTVRENFRRSLHWANLGVCKQGHAMTPENTYQWFTRGVLNRMCLKCRLRSRRRWLNRRLGQSASLTSHSLPQGMVAS